MSPQPPSDARRTTHRHRRVPITTRIGIGAAVFFGGVGALTGGFWMMLVMVAIVVLVTTAYGLAFRRSTWLRLPRKRTAAALGAVAALAVLISSGAAYGATHPSPPSHRPSIASSAPRIETAAAAPENTRTPTPTPKPTPTPTPTPTVVVTTKLFTETIPVPFRTATVASASLAKGTSSVTTAGVKGVETKTYTVTYSNGTETSRVLKSDVVTKQPVTQVTTVGTYSAPAAPTCTNGTYVNSAGNTVCRPETSSTAPSGATAKCADGTYSFSQSRRGTCSSHGGVAEWL